MERYKIQDTELARRDMDEIVSYIAVEFNAQATALRMADMIDNAIKGLSHMPYRHPLIDDERLAALGYRKLNIKNYIAFFIIDEESKTVFIERIIYARRDWLNIL